MAFDSGNELTFFTGLLPLRVVAINPTLQELHDLGYTYLTKEPKYTAISKNPEEKEVAQGIIMFYLENISFTAEQKEIPAGRCRVQQSFYISDEVRKSREGKIQYINERGHTRYAPSKEELKFNKVFTEDCVREALRGEEDLHQFLRAWFNFSIFSKCQIENPSELVKGNTEEIKGLTGLGKSLLGLVGMMKKETDSGNNVYNLIHSRMFYAGNTKSMTIYRAEDNSRDSVSLAEYVTEELKNEYMSFKRADYYSLTPESFNKDEALSKCESGVSEATVVDPDSFAEGDIKSLL